MQSKKITTKPATSSTRSHSTWRTSIAGRTRFTRASCSATEEEDSLTSSNHAYKKNVGYDDQ
eukprot:3471648-Pyramimonas_sp.AAC.1